MVLRGSQLEQSDQEEGWKALEEKEEGGEEEEEEEEEVQQPELQGQEQ